MYYDKTVNKNIAAKSESTKMAGYKLQRCRSYTKVFTHFFTRFAHCTKLCMHVYDGRVRPKGKKVRTDVHNQYNWHLW